jgi:hypothetical protein
MEARNAGPLGQAPSAESAEPGPTAVSVPRWYRRVSFWRAVAGMALAIAIACAVVAAEFSSTLIARTRHYHNRLRQLSSNISAMRGKIASADREIAGMRTAAEVNDSLRRIIAEPDSRLIRLEAPRHATAPKGVIAFSPGLRRAAIEIGGLPVVPGGRAYTLWWMCGKRGPLKAARMSLGATEKAALAIALPAVGDTIEGAIITTDSQASITTPSGDLVLKGIVVHSPSRTEIPKHKGG